MQCWADELELVGHAVAYGRLAVGSPPTDPYLPGTRPAPPWPATRAGKRYARRDQWNPVERMMRAGVVERDLESGEEFDGWCANPGNPLADPTGNDAADLFDLPVTRLNTLPDGVTAAGRRLTPQECDARALDRALARTTGKAYPISGGGANLHSVEKDGPLPLLSQTVYTSDRCSGEHGPECETCRYDALIRPVAAALMAALSRTAADLPTALKAFLWAAGSKDDDADRAYVAILTGLQAGHALSLRRHFESALAYGLKRHAAGAAEPCGWCSKRRQVCPPEHAAWAALRTKRFIWIEVAAYLHGQSNADKGPSRFPIERGRPGKHPATRPPPLETVLRNLGYPAVGHNREDETLWLTETQETAYRKASRGEALTHAERLARDSAYLRIEAHRMQSMQREDLEYLIADYPGEPQWATRREAGRRSTGYSPDLDSEGDYAVSRWGHIDVRFSDRPSSNAPAISSERDKGTGEATERLSTASRRTKPVSLAGGDGATDGPTEGGTRGRATARPEAYLAGKGCRTGSLSASGWRYSTCPSCGGDGWKAAYSPTSGRFLCHRAGCAVGAACLAARSNGRPAAISLRSLVAICDGPAAAAAYGPEPAFDPPDAPADLLPGQRTL